MKIESSDSAMRYSSSLQRPEAARDAEPDRDADDAAASKAAAPKPRAEPLDPEMGTKVNLLA